MIRSFLFFPSVLRGLADRQRTRVDPEVGELARVRVVLDLERERREGLLVARLAGDLFLSSHLGPHHRGQVRGRGEEVDHCVERRLDALVLESRAAQHRHDGPAEDARAKRCANLFGGHLLALEVALHERLVEVRGGLEHLIPRGGDFVSHVRRDVQLLELRTEGLVVPDEGLVLYEIDDSLEGVLGADGQLDPDRASTQAIHDHLDAALEVRPDPVHLLTNASRGTL